MTSRTRPIPAHGTASRYRGDPRKKRWTPCRCENCRTAWRRQRKTVELRIARGGTGRHDATPVIAHIQHLHNTGWAYQDIAKAAHIDIRGLRNIRTGQQKTVHHTTATKILALRGPNDPYKINAVGARRRIQALAAIGWSITSTAKQAGLSQRGAQDIAAGRRPHVTYATHTAIDAAYRKHELQPGPSSWARSFAAKRGWAVPLAWDNIDDPKARPSRGRQTRAGIDHAAVIRALEGERLELTGIERTAAVALGMRRGMTYEDIARELGMEEESVRRAWERTKERARDDAQQAQEAAA